MSEEQCNIWDFSIWDFGAKRRKSNDRSSGYDLTCYFLDANLGDIFGSWSLLEIDDYFWRSVVGERRSLQLTHSLMSRMRFMADDIAKALMAPKGSLESTKEKKAAPFEA